MCEIEQSVTEQLAEIKSLNITSDLEDVYEAAEPKLLSLPVEVNLFCLHFS